jgi:hypothetical protein
MRGRPLSVCALILLLSPVVPGTGVLAQRANRVGITTLQPSVGPTGARPVTDLVAAAVAPDTPATHTPWAVLASAIVPGAGQAILGQDRFIPYLAVEAYAWARYAGDKHRGRRDADRYRTLAKRVAQAAFAPAPPTGNFDYYERMEHFIESGSFDAMPGGDLDPEPDSTTYNGSVWLLARQTYWENPGKAPPRDSPEYLRAEAFYKSRAVASSFRWSWRNAQLEYDEFRRTIRQSNDGYRSALQDLGLVIANHALSTVDALVTIRLRRHASARGYDIGATIPF